MGKNNDWYCYDDENVYPVSFQDIKNNGYPIVLFYMMASIFRDEFQQHFYNSCQNNIFDNVIQNNFLVFNTILPMNNQGIYNSMSKKIFEFKNKYKGSFVDNFYFLLLNLSKCPQCANLLGYHSPDIASFFN